MNIKVPSNAELDAITLAQDAADGGNQPFLRHPFPAQFMKSEDRRHQIVGTRARRLND